MSSDVVRVRRSGRVLEIMLAAPERNNAIDLRSVQELADATNELDAGVGCVLILGEGKNFSVGGNVREFAAADRPGEYVGELASAFHRAELALVQAPVPVVVGVQGWAAGAGMSLALAADLLVLERSARMRPAYTAIAVTPDGGMSWTLPRALGSARALDLVLTNRVLDAEEAQGAGLVSRVVEDGAVHAAAGELAAAVAEGPTGALGAAKTLLRDSAGRTFAEQLDVEARSIAACAEGSEGWEGISAFAEGRPPRFR